MVLWLKLIHVAAVVIFLGNIITGVFWHRHAVRTRDQRFVAHTMAGIIRSDRWFTIPGVLVIIASGAAGAIAAGYPILGTRWILWSLVLFTVAGVAFLARLAPLQRQMAALASAPAGHFTWDKYLDQTRRWEFWGAVALVTPLAALVLMVLKPGS